MRRLLALGVAMGLVWGRPAEGQEVDYTREVRPILAGKCFQCHGPDEAVRKAGLRLDTRDGALRELPSGSVAVVPGDPDQSELIGRVTDPGSSVMPPPKVGKRLSEKEVSLLRRWIQQGAKYAQHWAYVPPRRPTTPAVRDSRWPINPIDAFILARLEQEGLKPTPQADRFTLIRRVTLDLTGLPPSLDEVERAVNDSAPDWYEKYVDRVLASPHFGERWAQVWLDLARYADSQGYANDPDRTIWRWRDWVIQALNDNMPYDRFTIEQLAGDLLPEATTAQLIATGFHRNTLTNSEGGTNDEEFRSVAVVDRVNTTFQVWLATTIACAQCHNHKYDPFSQKEYFQLYAIFNNTLDNDTPDDAPTISVPATGFEKEYEQASRELAEARAQLDAETKKLDAARADWEKTVDPATLPRELAELLSLPVEKRDKGRQQKLVAHHRQLSETWKALDARVRDLDATVKKLGTTTPVMREGKPRPTYIHIRGNFLDRGEKVEPGLPAIFAPASPPAEPLNRLTFAKWLVRPDNPLTARVAVNRFWEEIFGIGIVETSEDFGIQGELPSHPELLDWLATEFMASGGGESSHGWDVKRLLRLIVTSATYRQGSQVSPELGRRDPYNRLLARGPRVRLSGEAVRDQALFVSGLLSPKLYGPPVQPPRPTFGLSAAFGGATDWKADTGPDRYRRGLYIRVRRNAPYPSLTTFDAPERTVCTVRRLRTNTPLQALVTLNDPVFVEAAQALARRIVSEGGASVEARAAFAFRLCLIRPPAEQELKRLVELYQQARARYSADPNQAAAMATRPLGPAPKDMDLADLAAWTVVANVLLNLDETLVKR